MIVIDPAARTHIQVHVLGVHLRCAELRAPRPTRYRPGALGDHSTVRVERRQRFESTGTHRIIDHQQRMPPVRRPQRAEHVVGAHPTGDPACSPRPSSPSPFCRSPTQPRPTVGVRQRMGATASRQTTATHRPRRSRDGSGRWRVADGSAHCHDKDASASARPGNLPSSARIFSKSFFAIARLPSAA